MTRTSLLSRLRFNRSNDAVESDPILAPNVRLESFEKVWTTVRDKHWDPSLHGLDWNGVREEFLPKAAEAETAEKLDEVLNEMLGRLGQSHFGVIPSDVYKSIEDPTSESKTDTEDSPAGVSPIGTIGASLRLVDGQVIVWRIDPEGSAANAGIRTGWILQSLDGEEIPSRLKRISEGVSSMIDPELLRRLIVDHLSDGPLGKIKPFVWLDAEGKSHESHLAFKTPSGVQSKFGNLPATHVTCDAKVLDSGVMVFASRAVF
jgi:carboxyl-terminal processing protease